MIEIRVHRNGLYFWTLKAKNGAVIAFSEGFKSRNACMRNIKTVQKLIVDVEIVDG